MTIRFCKNCGRGSAYTYCASCQRMGFRGIALGVSLSGVVALVIFWGYYLSS